MKNNNRVFRGSSYQLRDHFHMWESLRDCIRTGDLTSFCFGRVKEGRRKGQSTIIFLEGVVFMPYIFGICQFDTGPFVLPHHFAFFISSIALSLAQTKFVRTGGK